MAKEIAKRETTDVANIDNGMFTGMDSGFEGTSSETFKTPFLKVLQAQSPELNKNKPEYVKGAEQGMFCNSATKDLYEDIDVIVLKIEHSIVVWKPERGGLVGRFHKDEESNVVAEQEGLKKWDRDGNEVIDTIEFYCMNANDPADIFILPMATTSLKYGKSWATKMRLLKANGKPVNVSWAGVWNIKLVEETNDKGSWYTVGNTPTFQRFITQDERDSFILPAKEMLKTAETDYSQVDAAKQSDESVEC